MIHASRGGVLCLRVPIYFTDITKLFKFNILDSLSLE